MKKIKSWFKVTHRYDYKGHSRISRVLYFYIRQIFKSGVLLYLAYIPIDMVRGFYLNVAALNSIDAKTAFVAEQTTSMYGMIAAVLMGGAIYSVIFKIQWHYIDYIEAKNNRQIRFDNYFKPENKKKKTTFKETMHNTYESNKDNRPLDHLTQKMDNHKRKLLHAKNKAKNAAKSKSNRKKS